MTEEASKTTNTVIIEQKPDDGGGSDQPVINLKPINSAWIEAL